MKHYSLPPHFIVKAGIHGIGVFVTKDLKKDEIIFKMSGKIIDHPTRTSVQIDKNLHIEDKLAGHVNHSCAPNAKIDRKKRAFVCIAPIKKGDEITFDYNQNEDTLASPFECLCCHRKIKGKKHLSKSKRFETEVHE